MNDDALLDLAGRLGDLLAADPRFARLRETENKVLAAPELRRLMEEYEQARLGLAQKERTFTPIDPTEKRAYAEIAKRVQGEALLRDLAAAQADYAAMMNKVNTAIQSRLSSGLVDPGDAAE